MFSSSPSQVSVSQESDKERKSSGSSADDAIARARNRLKADKAKRTTYDDPDEDEDVGAVTVLVNYKATLSLIDEVEGLGAASQSGSLRRQQVGRLLDEDDNASLTKVLGARNSVVQNLLNLYKSRDLSDREVWAEAFAAMEQAKAIIAKQMSAVSDKMRVAEEVAAEVGQPPAVVARMAAKIKIKGGGMAGLAGAGTHSIFKDTPASVVYFALAAWDAAQISYFMGERVYPTPVSILQTQPTNPPKISTESVRYMKVLEQALSEGKDALSVDGILVPEVIRRVIVRLRRGTATLGADDLIEIVSTLESGKGNPDISTLR